MAGGVDDEVAAGESDLSTGIGLSATQGRLDSGHQDAWAERLGDMIFGPERADDDVRLSRADTMMIRISAVFGSRLRRLHLRDRRGPEA